eukprot:gene6-8_t
MAASSYPPPYITRDEVDLTGNTSTGATATNGLGPFASMMQAANNTRPDVIRQVQEELKSEIGRLIRGPTPVPGKESDDPVAAVDKLMSDNPILKAIYDEYMEMSAELRERVQNATDAACMSENVWNALEAFKKEADEERVDVQAQLDRALAELDMLKRQRAAPTAARKRSRHDR